MKTCGLFRWELGALALILAGCASTPDPSGDVSMIIGTDGTYEIVDENGDPVENEDMETLAQLLGQAMAETNQAAELADDEIWSVDSHGNLTHIQSGGICPYEWDEFTLIRPSIFRRDGSDVGCGYQSASLNAIYTFYFYRNDEPLEQHLNGAVETIKSRAPTAKPADLHYLGPGPHFYSGQVVETTVGEGTKRDAVLIADDDGWRVKLRMTYPGQFAMEHEHLGAIMLQGQLDRVGHDSVGVQPEIDHTDPELNT